MLNLLSCVPGGVTGLMSPAICTDQSPFLVHSWLRLWAAEHSQQECNRDVPRHLEKSSPELARLCASSGAGRQGRFSTVRRNALGGLGWPRGWSPVPSQVQAALPFSCSPLHGGSHVLSLSPRGYILLCRFLPPGSTVSGGSRQKRDGCNTRNARCSNQYDHACVLLHARKLIKFPLFNTGL